jgi:isoquinoline 1-oxidoreductase
VSCAFHGSESPLKQGSYRSLAAVANAFARETHMDELADLAKVDPLEFRLRNITNPRLSEVLKRAADRFGWGKKKSGSGVGYGIACNIEKASLVATCAEVETGGKEPHVRRMATAFDCGAVLNPDNLRNQITGAQIMGLGGALFEQLQFDKQRIVNGRLSRYRVPRFSDIPEFEVIVVDRKDVPSAGAGETPITTVAPAVGSALFAATGDRKRRLPLLG